MPRLWIFGHEPKRAATTASKCSLAEPGNLDDHNRLRQAKEKTSKDDGG